MAEGGVDPTTPETEAEECAALQQRLDATRADCSQLKHVLYQASSDKATAKEAGLAGIRAAKAHMEQLRAELVAVRRWLRSKTAGDKIDEANVDTLGECSDGEQASEEDEERKTHKKAMQVEVRSHRHVLARWKHQVEITEAKVPRQEDEIIRLKAELTHTLDILTSTQHAVKHHEVEMDLRQEAAAADVPEAKVSLLGGGHGCVEAQAERIVREKIEGKNVRLSGKAKRLSGVVAAQQLLIQRLEKQLLQEELQLEQKDDHLDFQNTRMSQLKALTRKRSDKHVAKMLGVALDQPNRRKAPSANSSVMSSLQGSASVPNLPPI